MNGWAIISCSIKDQPTFQMTSFWFTLASEKLISSTISEAVVSNTVYRLLRGTQFRSKILRATEYEY